MRHILAAVLVLFALPVLGANPPGGSSAAPLGQSGLLGLVGQPPYYVSNFGAKFNGIKLTDVSITSGTNIACSASYTFKQSDVAKSMGIYGAGASTSLPLNTAISSIGTGGSAGCALLAANAGTTVTPSSTVVSLQYNGVTYGTAVFATDDTTAIQAAETAAANAGGGLVVFPRGITSISAPITVGNNVSFMGQGAGKSIFHWISSVDMTGAFFFGYTGTNTGCTPAVALGWQDNQFHDYEIDGSLATNVTGNIPNNGKGIELQCGTRSKVYQMYVHDTPMTCVATDISFPTDVSHNTLANCGRLDQGGGGNGIGNGSTGQPGEAYTFVGNIIFNSIHWGILLENENITPTSVTSNSPATITGNVIYAGALTHGATQENNGGISVGTIGTTITGNYLFGDASSPQWAGISTGYGTVTVAGGAETVVVGNSIFNAHVGIAVRYDRVGLLPFGLISAPLICNNRVSNSGSFGILLFATASTTFKNAKICGNNVHNGNNPAIGLLGAGGFVNVDIDDNQLWDNGPGSAGPLRSGVYVNAPITNLNMRNNTAFDDGATKQSYGLAIDTSGAVTAQNVAGNDFARNTVGTIDLLGTMTGGVINLFPNVLTSALTACAAGTKNWIGSVSDATAPTYLGTLTGGSTVGVNVRCNGTNWVTE